MGKKIQRGVNRPFRYICPVHGAERSIRLISTELIPDLPAKLVDMGVRLSCLATAQELLKDDFLVEVRIPASTTATLTMRKGWEVHSLRSGEKIAAIVWAVWVEPETNQVHQKASV